MQFTIGRIPYAPTIYTIKKTKYYISFCILLCRKASDSWVCAANALTITNTQTITMSIHNRAYTIRPYNIYHKKDGMLHLFLHLVV